MVIDIHTHIFPDKIAAEVIEHLSKQSRAKYFSDGTLNGLLDSMKKFGIDKSVILPVATAPRQVEKINDYAAKMTEKFSDSGIIYFACIHPDFENYRTELNRVKNLGLKGIKIHPIYQGVNLDDKKFLQILYCAAELDLIVITHAGLDIGFPGMVGCSPKMARHVVEEIGNFKFVLAHMGGWKNWDEVLIELADTKIFVDTAFSVGAIPARSDFIWNDEDLKLLNADEFMKLYKVFGADRILFGTDSPWDSPATVMNFIKNLPISEVEKNKILGNNSEKLLEMN